MRAHINYKAHYYKKVNASKLEERDYVYVHYNRRYIIKAVKVVSLICVRVGSIWLKKFYQLTTNWYAKSEPIKTQVLCRMLLQPFKWQEPVLDV